MRAYVVDRLSNKLDVIKSSPNDEADNLEQIAHVLFGMRGELTKIEGLVEQIWSKTSQVNRSSSVCHKEMVKLLKQLARTEMITLEIYWKSREVLGQLPFR